MALTQTQTQLRANVRRTGDWEGTSMTNRHSDSDVNDAIDRARGAFDRLIREVIPDGYSVSTATVTTSDGTSTYALDSTFRSLLSVDIVANGIKSWLDAYNLVGERAGLSVAESGVPFCYRLRGSNIEFLPIPNGVYTATLHFIPASTQGNNTLDTIERLDDYVIWYATRELATKDRIWDLVDRMTQRLSEIRDEVYVIARNRDMNALPRVIDVRPTDRWGRYR